MPLNPMVGTGKISPFIWSVSKPGAPQSGRGPEVRSAPLQG